MTHTLTVFNAVDVPLDVQESVAALLAPYKVDVYERACDAAGVAR